MPVVVLWQKYWKFEKMLKKCQKLLFKKPENLGLDFQNSIGYSKFWVESDKKGFFSHFLFDVT